MLKRNPRSVTGLVGLTLAALLALPAAASANTSGPIAQTGGMTVILPLLGNPLKIAVTLDVVGNISNVDVDPVGDFSATHVGPHAVSFATTDGSTKVSVRALGDRMSVRASSKSLDNLVGSGTWSADLFGTGDTTKVNYTVGKAVDGSPTLKIDSVNAAPSDVTVDQKSVQTMSNDWGSSASDRIDFTRNGFTKHLWIRVSLRKEGDDKDSNSTGLDRPASLSFQLSGKDRQVLTNTLAKLEGTHTWTGVNCDGTPATVTFTVNHDGTVSFVSAVPPATASDTEHGFRARFDGTHSKVQVRLWQNKDLTWTLQVDARGGWWCKDTPAKAPTVHTPVLPGATVDHHFDPSHKTGFGKERGIGSFGGLGLKDKPPA
jgi:hypothetical protein